MKSTTEADARCIYLDYNGTTPIHPSVVEAMMPYLTTHFGNPSSSHHYGHEPKRAVDQARGALLRLIRPQGCCDETDLSSIIFTGCGTESNNLAIRLALLSSRDRVDENGLLHVVTTNIEHPAITQCLASYEQNEILMPKIIVSYVPVNNEGVV